MVKGDSVKLRLATVVEEVSECFPFWLVTLMGIHCILLSSFSNGAFNLQNDLSVIRIS